MVLFCPHGQTHRRVSRPYVTHGLPHGYVIWPCVPCILNFSFELTTRAETLTILINQNATINNNQIRIIEIQTVISELTLVDFAFFLLSRDFRHNVSYLDFKLQTLNFLFSSFISFFFSFLLCFVSSIMFLSFFFFLLFSLNYYIYIYYLYLNQ